ncbi:coiled-coil domain-containing protein [Anaeramoeba flamelloides]|uniref:Coiled-coil domain-containing protein n=1 Tax=Anaeramoeba flamelloides TaxID=1746091 RepID=A0AAV7ZNI9_9EUKA|nr:coiled-coil domain-containing protein [Anaeramoeba flamelloides]
MNIKSLLFFLLIILCFQFVLTNKNEPDTDFFSDDEIIFSDDEITDDSDSDLDVDMESLKNTRKPSKGGEDLNQEQDLEEHSEEDFFSDDFDGDEDDGFKQDDFKKLKKDLDKKKGIKIEEIQVKGKTDKKYVRVKFRLGPFEYLMVALLLFFVSLWFFGKRKNKMIAQKWRDQFFEIFEKQFCIVGQGVDSQLTKLASHEHWLYCTGRKQLHSLLAQIKLKKRQDLFHYVLGWMYSPNNNDQVVIDVLFDNIKPFIYVVTKKSNKKRIIRDCYDVKTFADPIDKFVSDYCVITDCRSVANDFSTPKFQKLLTDNQEFLELIHVTDRNPYGKHPNNLRFVFNLPPTNKMELLTELMNFVFEFIDLIPNVKMQQKQIQKATELRKKADANLKKNEEEERNERKEDEKRKKIEEEEKKVQNMSQEQQEKYYKRREKKMLRKQGPKMKKIKV